jgi:CubicO group peptidase (beta-lactamase class C family)
MDWRLGYHRVFTSCGTLPNAFGHFGFGGSGGWADPSRELSVAMVCSRGTGTPIGDLRIAGLGAAAVRCADRLANADRSQRVDTAAA